MSLRSTSHWTFLACHTTVHIVISSTFWAWVKSHPAWVEVACTFMVLTRSCHFLAIGTFGLYVEDGTDVAFKFCVFRFKLLDPVLLKIMMWQCIKYLFLQVWIVGQCWHSSSESFIPSICFPFGLLSQSVHDDWWIDTILLFDDRMKFWLDGVVLFDHWLLVDEAQLQFSIKTFDLLFKTLYMECILV